MKIHQRGGAVEAGCSGLHYIIGCFITSYHTTHIHCTPLRLHPPSMNTQEMWGPHKQPPPTRKLINANYAVLSTEFNCCIISYFRFESV